jgi:DNA polymerase III alpha subunit
MFRDIPEAITNTQKIADKCSFEFSRKDKHTSLHAGKW